jgi:hypothetical protein
VRELREIIRGLKAQAKSGTLDLKATVEALEAVDKRIVAIERRLPPAKTMEIKSPKPSAGGAFTVSKSGG